MFTLALDTERFVVSPAWEVMLAPSIVQKKLLRGLIRLDRKAGRLLTDKAWGPSEKSPVCGF